MLRYSRKDVNRKLVGVRIIDRDELDAGVHQRRMKARLRDSRSSLAMTSLAFCRLQIVKAFSSSGRSSRLPLSISVNSPISDQVPPFR